MALLRNQSGQIAVLILLVSIVGLTIGLSIASRSIKTVKQTGEEDASSRAFSAAEAGIEKALVQLEQTGSVGAIPPETLESGAEIKEVQVITSGTTGYEVENVEKDDGVQVVLYDDSVTPVQSFNGTLRVHWDTDGAWGTNTSLVLTEIYGTGPANYQVKKYAYNCGVMANNFSSPTSSALHTVVGSAHQYQCYQNLALQSDTKLLRLRTMYNGTHIAVEPQSAGPSGQATLPAQSTVIRATGKAGETERVVEVERSKPALPAIFDFVLFSGSETQPLEHE